MKIERCKSMVLFLCLLLIGMLFQTTTAYAADDYDPDKKGSITVCLDDIGTNRKGVWLACYKVGHLDTFNGSVQGFLPETEYESLRLHLNELGDPSKHRAAADSLMHFIEREGIEPYKDGRTDSEGAVVLGELEHGMYLVRQRDSFHTYGTTEPFLIAVPYIGDGQIFYDVKTETKAEPPKETEPPEETDPPEKTDPPEETEPPVETEPPETIPPAKSTAEMPEASAEFSITGGTTGDNTPIAFWCGLFVMSLAVILAMIGKKKEWDE